MLRAPCPFFSKKYVANSLKRLHRDLKSANLLVSASMRVKVADFGTTALLENILNHAGQRGDSRHGKRSDRNIKRKLGAKKESSLARRTQTRGVGTPL